MSTESKATELESKGLYRRAGAIYSALTGTAPTEAERERLRACANRCAELAKRPPQQIDTFGEVSRAASSTAQRMGIAQENGNAFRLNGGKREP